MSDLCERKILVLCGNSREHIGARRMKKITMQYFENDYLFKNVLVEVFNVTISSRKSKCESLYHINIVIWGRQTHIIIWGKRISMINNMG